MTVIEIESALQKLAKRQSSPELVADGIAALKEAAESGKNVCFYQMRNYVGPVYATPEGKVKLVKTIHCWNGGTASGDEYELSDEGGFNY